MIVFIIVVLFLFKDVIFAADRSILSLGGDGCKNLYAYLYQIFYGKGYWFEGMNYPYGEHIVFTDAQPAVSLTLSLLYKWLHFSPGTALATMHYLMALSFVLGMWYTYLLLVHFKVHPVMAIPASVFILILSPQVFRIAGHYPLSYSCFLPMLFYGTLRYYETSRWKYLVYLYVLCVIYAFLHLYFLGMSFLWMLAYVGGYIIVVRGKAGQKWKHALLYGGALAAAFLTVQLFIRVTDPVTDRPLYPNIASAHRPLWDLCTSLYSPIWQALKEKGLATNVKDDAEGAAYLGFVLMILLPVGLVRWIVRSIRKKEPDGSPAFQHIWVFVALSTLVFAMSLSALWDISFLKEPLKPLRQFRAPERFSWIFYYVMSVYAAILLYRMSRGLFRQGHKVLAVVLAVVMLGIWSIDANGNLLFLRRDAARWQGNYNFFFAKDKKSWPDFLKEHGHQPQDFQTILVIPFVHVGSEKIWPGEVDSYSMTLAFMASVQMHLPIMDVYMSRTSWQQTFDQVKTGAGMYAGKPVLELLKSDKPILLLHFTPYPVNPDEQYLFDHSEPLGMQDECMMYVFHPKQFLQRQRMELDSVYDALSHRAAGDTVQSVYPVCQEHYDDHKAQEVFAGTGALPAITGQDSLLLNWTLPAPADTIQYEFSIWTKVPAKGPNQPYFTLYFKDAGNKELNSFISFGKYSVDNAPGAWFRVNSFFRMPAGTKRMEVAVSNPDGAAYLFLDELLIRPANATILSKAKKGYYLINNHVLKGSE